ARRRPHRLRALRTAPPHGRVRDVRRAHPARDRDTVAELVRVGGAALLPGWLPPRAAARRRDAAHPRPTRPGVGVPDPARAVDPACPHRVFVAPPSRRRDGTPRRDPLLSAPCPAVSIFVPSRRWSAGARSTPCSRFSPTAMAVSWASASWPATSS